MLCGRLLVVFLTELGEKRLGFSSATSKKNKLVFVIPMEWIIQNMLGIKSFKILHNGRAKTYFLNRFPFKSLNFLVHGLMISSDGET